jgi:hypothetical protein
MQVMQAVRFSLRTLLVSSLLLVLAAMASIAGAQASTHVGARVGYNFEAEEVILSANLTVPISTRIEFYPSLDIYLPERGNKIGFNGDVKVLLPMASGPHLYGGGGIGVVNQNFGDISNTDVGVNLLVGLESKVGWIHPFGELKFLIHDQKQFVAIAGVNMTLGGR